MSLDFTGKTAIVTGATRGIGKAIASQLQGRGARVIGTGKIRFPKCPAWLDRYVRCDFNNAQHILQMCEGFLHTLDRLDVLVQNAGTNVNAPIWKIETDTINMLMRVNLIAPFSIARAACRVMQRQGHGGHIVNIGSIWAETGKTGRSVYAATKAGLAGMIRAMAADMAPHGVLVNMVSPGFTQTELTDRTLTTQKQRELALQIPLGRFAQPVEIARLVVWLCSDENTYITGQNITIDGGFHNVRQ